jgi:uncharacterized protein
VPERIPGGLPIELYRSGKSRYVFDPEGVVFIEVDPLSFSLLEILKKRFRPLREIEPLFPRHPPQDVRSSYAEIRKLLGRGYLRAKPFKRQRRFSRSEFVDALSRRMAGLTVNITTRCNLACSYCIYGGSYGRYRELPQTSMSWETAKRAMDFLAEHSPLSKTIQLDFFGGEPLLAFDQIRKSVEYLQRRLGRRRTKLLITISSNGTVLTDPILDFLRRNNVYLQFSIDGSREIHDRKRRFRSNRRGSYARIIRNLERIHDADPEYFIKHLRIKCVVPLDTLALPESSLMSHPLLRLLDLKNAVSYLIKETHYSTGEDEDYLKEIRKLELKLLAQPRVRTLDELQASLRPREQLFFHETLAEFVEIQALNKFYFGKSRSIPFTKSCMMGYAEAAVEPNGDILICHKATSFVIGNVNEGRWDFDRIVDLERRMRSFEPECAACFVRRFCDLCFEKLDGARWESSRRSFCRFQRKRYTLIFGTMLRILDRNPDLWADLDALVTRRIKEKVEEMKTKEGKGPA